LGDLHTALENPAEATRYYDRAARMGRGTKQGRAAERMLGDAPAVLTDTERGSLLLAWREVLGLVLFFVLLAWQDAGLEFANMGQPRWLGIALAAIGGYFVITATSSPQQRPLARWLGGKLPDEDGKPKRKEGASEGIGEAIHDTTEIPIIGTDIRIIIGIVGGVMLAVAFWLTFNTAIQLLFDPKPVPDLMQIEDVFPPAIVELYRGG
jgi:hypothetical protein